MATVSIVTLSLLVFIEGRLAGPFNAKPSIVNGQRASLGEFPYQISLQENGQHNCGGSILNENYVLTAAHCVANRPASNLKVVAGTIDLNNVGGGGSSHTVTYVKVHEQYSPGDSWKNDIALLKVNPPFKFSSTLGPLQLPGPTETFADKQAAIVSGFGAIGVNGRLSPQLLKTNVNIENHSTCQRKFFANRIYNTNLCTVNINTATGFCNGDSGGPLTVNGKVAGVVSFALNNGCANLANESQVYTRVSEYIKWISDNSNGINENNDNVDNNNNNDWQNDNNNDNNNNNGPKNPTQEFQEWLNQQNQNDKDWLPNLQQKYQEWLQSVG